MIDHISNINCSLLASEGQFVKGISEVVWHTAAPFTLGKGSDQHLIHTPLGRGLTNILYTPWLISGELYAYALVQSAIR